MQARRSRELRIDLVQRPRERQRLADVIDSCDPQDGTLDPHAGPLVHAAGDVLAFDLATELREHGFSVDQPVVYRMQPIARLSRLILAEIGTGELDAVMLLSPRTADIWVQLVSKIGLQKEAARLLHLCLSPAIARRLAPLGPTRIETARQPTLDDLLALVS